MKPPSWHKGHPKRAEGENYHHVFWEGKDYKRLHERKFRNHVGLVIPLKEDVHNYLHLIVPAPPKPLKSEMSDCIDFIEERDKWEHEGRFWAMDAAMQYFVYRGADQPQHEERCKEIRHNLAMQIGIMSTGKTGELILPNIETISSMES